MIEGVWPVVATPFLEDGSIDEESLLLEIRFLSSLGVAGVVLGGITSEVHKLSTEEKRWTVSLVSSELGGRLPFIAGCGEASFELTLGSVRHAASCGGAASMIFPAFAVAAGPETVRALFGVCAGTLPLILQDSSFFGGQALEPANIASIVNGNESIVALKIESPPSATRMRAVSAQLTRPVSLVSGQGGQYLSDEISAGASAIFPGPAFPPIYLPFFPCLNDASGVPTESRVAFLPPGRPQLPIHLLRYMFQSAEFAIACYKQLLADKGIIASARTRRPGVALDDESAARLRDLAKEAGV